jgi:hypothetical protein
LGGLDAKRIDEIFATEFFDDHAGRAGSDKKHRPNHENSY